MPIEASGRARARRHFAQIKTKSGAKICAKSHIDKSMFSCYNKTEKERGVQTMRKAFWFDMDGTIYLDDRLFDGAEEFLSHIRETGGRYVFLTNNSSKGRDSYIEKMQKLGIAARPEDFITSVDALVYRLKDCYGKEAVTRKMYIMGTESFKEHMRAE